MSLSAVLVGFLFLGFVILMALRGSKTRKEVKECVHKDVEYISERTKNRHKKKRGRASSELAEARRTYLKMANGRASASKL